MELTSSFMAEVAVYSVRMPACVCVVRSALSSAVNGPPGWTRTGRE